MLQKRIKTRHLLRWCDTLLLVDLGTLFGFRVETEALFKGLLLQHKSGSQPQVVRLAQVFEHAGTHGDGGHTLRHGFDEAVQGAGLTISLSLVAAAAQERAHFSG